MKSKSETPIEKLLRLIGAQASDEVSTELFRAFVESKQEYRELLRYRHRLEWLHQGGGEKDEDGYEWGVARVKFDNYGQVVGALWTNIDHSDLDAEIERCGSCAICGATLNGDPHPFCRNCEP